MHETVQWRLEKKKWEHVLFHGGVPGPKRKDLIRQFKDVLQKAKTQNITLNKSGYPKDLKVLVEGDDFGGVDKTKKKFLRRIPIDPFNPPKPGEEPRDGRAPRSRHDGPRRNRTGRARTPRVAAREELKGQA